MQKANFNSMFFIDCNRTHDEESLRAPDPLDTETGMGLSLFAWNTKHIFRAFFFKISSQS